MVVLLLWCAPVEAFLSMFDVICNKIPSIIVVYEWNGSWQACVSCGRTVSSPLAKLNLVSMDLVAYLLTAWASARLCRHTSGFPFLQFSISAIRHSLMLILLVLIYYLCSCLLNIASH